MGKYQYGRKKIKVTEKWFKNFCKPKLTKRDKKIFKFIYNNRIVTSAQIAKMYFSHSKNPQKLCNSRLRKLYRLNCINRFFPPVEQGKGSSKAHYCLDRAGFKALKINNFQRYKKLPIDYKHKILVADFRIEAFKSGWDWGELEKDFEILKPDIFYLYNSREIFVEVDTGSENKRKLKKKGEKYNQIEPDLLIFLAKNKKRIKFFMKNIFSAKNFIGCKHCDIKKVFSKI